MRKALLKCFKGNALTMVTNHRQMPIPVKQRKAHVLLPLGSGENEVTCKGPIDTGNTITEEAGIEEKIHKTLNIGFSSTGGTPIGNRYR